MKLEQNYRSTGNILRAANAIIARNTERRPKRLFTEAAAGEPIISFEGETERDEAEFVAATIGSALGEDAGPADFAVFYRTNGQSRVLEEALRGARHPLRGRGRHALLRPRRDQGPDRLPAGRSQNPDDEMALLRIVNTPGPGHRRRHRSTSVAALGPARSGWACGRRWSGRRRGGDDPRRLTGQRPAQEAGGVRRADEPAARGRAALGPAALAEKVLEDSGYRDALAAEASLEAEGRMENLLELVAQMREYEREAEEPTLAGFLERIALASDVDGYDPEKGAVSLMTVHTAKGLEFPWVFLTGLEENIFPHARSVDDDAAIEEERRLCYVAVTRAMRRLFLTRVRRRRLSGQELPGVPSRFLRDLPAECLERSCSRARPTCRSTPTGPAPGRAAGTATCTSTERGRRARGRGRQPPATGPPARGRRARPARPPAAHRADHRALRRGRRRRRRRWTAASWACASAPSCATRSSAWARCAAGSRRAPT